MEPSGPLQACNGTALPFYLVWFCIIRILPTGVLKFKCKIPAPNVKHCVLGRSVRGSEFSVAARKGRRCTQTL